MTEFHLGPITYITLWVQAYDLCLLFYRDQLGQPLETADENYEALVERGLKFDSAPANMPWGTRMAACSDPEGFQIEIVGPLKS